MDTRFDTESRFTDTRIMDEMEQSKRFGREFDLERGAPVADAAYDQWLTHHLHQLFDPVVSEPIPAELIRLLEHRLK